MNAFVKQIIDTDLSTMEADFPPSRAAFLQKQSRQGRAAKAQGAKAQGAKAQGAKAKKTAQPASPAATATDERPGKQPTADLSAHRFFTCPLTTDPQEVRRLMNDLVAGKPLEQYSPEFQLQFYRRQQDLIDVLMENVSQQCRIEHQQLMDGAEALKIVATLRRQFRNALDCGHPLALDFLTRLTDQDDVDAVKNRFGFISGAELTQGMAGYILQSGTFSLKPKTRPRARLRC